MNPLDRGTTSPNPQQEAQASSSQRAGGSQQIDSSLQANIANVNSASTSQPVTMAIPVAANVPQFIPALSYSNLIESPAKDRAYVFDSSNQNVLAALSRQNLSSAAGSAALQINNHRTLLNGIHIPVFKYQLTLTFMLSNDRRSLQRFIKEVFTRLEKQGCYYDRVDFICSLLMLADTQLMEASRQLIQANREPIPTDRQHHCYQTIEELKRIVETYIPNPGENTYLQSNWNIDWPHSQHVRETQDLHKSNVDSITPEIKKSIYLKMEELISACTSEQKKKGIKRIYYIDAAFAYGASPGVLRAWVMDGKKLYENQIAARQQLIASEQRSSVLAQPQAVKFNPGIVIDDDQRPGPSRSTRTSATLRFEPYQRVQPQALSIDPSIQNQAQALGLTAETLQAFNLEAELDAEFNRQMEVLPWPSVTSRHFIREPNSGRYVIMLATRMEIGRFIVENCPADARVYRFAALRYGVALSEIVKWASEASE